MNYLMYKIKQTAFTTVMIAALGTAAIAEQALANNLGLNISGYVTVISLDGTTAIINGDVPGAPYYGARTPVSGTMSFDPKTNSGSMTMQPFSFLGNVTSPMDISFYDIDGPSGAGTLMLGNMVVDFGVTVGIPVSIVWDAKGMLDAISSGLSVGDSIAATNADFSCDTNINCATPATNDFSFMIGPGNIITLPIGASPVATSTWNTTDIGTITLGTNPSGTLPLIADTIGGSPMKAGPFAGLSPNFDFDNMIVTALPVQSIDIDIKPGSDTKSINQSAAGVVPVAILSSDDFDALSVDPTTVSLAGASVKLVGKSDKYLCHQEDVNLDGLIDIVCQVYTAGFMVDQGETTAILEAKTIDGTNLRGEDYIRIVPDN